MSYGQIKSISEDYRSMIEESRALEKAGERLGEYLGKFANTHPKGKIGKKLRNMFPSIRRGTAKVRARDLEWRADDIQDLLDKIDTKQPDLFDDSVRDQEIKRFKSELNAYLKAASRYRKMAESTDAISEKVVDLIEAVHEKSAYDVEKRFHEAISEKILEKLDSMKVAQAKKMVEKDHDVFYTKEK